MPEPMGEIPFPDEFRIGNVFNMTVFDLDYENVEYGYRRDGPFDPDAGHWFDDRKIFMNPYAKVIGGRDVWGVTPDWSDIYHHRSRIALDDFDWEDNRPLEIPPEDLIVYEMHVRSFTKHSSSGVKHPGTFAGIREKIAYLKELGVNCVELIPVYEFALFEQGVAKPIFVKQIAVKQAGIIKLELPQDLPQLQSGKDYRWSISIVQFPTMTSLNPISQSFVTRIDLTSNQAKQLKAITSGRDRAAFYAEAGIWYDALEAIATDYLNKPTDPTLRADLGTLLNQIGLPQVLEQKL